MKRYEVISTDDMNEYPELETDDINEAIQKARECDFYISKFDRKHGSAVEIRDYEGAKYDELNGWNFWSLVDFKEHSYWLYLYDDDFTLYEAGDDGKEICCGRLSDLGIGENDPNHKNKLDDYFEKEFGIKPDEWEVRR